MTKEPSPMNRPASPGVPGRGLPGLTSLVFFLALAGCGDDVGQPSTASGGGGQGESADATSTGPVSYTHLTLPTKRIV